MRIEYIVVSYMNTPGRWTVSLHTEDGEDYHTTVKSTVEHGPWELYVNSRFPGVPIKLYDWRTKSWAAGTGDLA
jgi:hypothetical protein